MSTEKLARVVNPILDVEMQVLGPISFFQKFLPSLIGMGFIIGVIVFMFMMIAGGIQWIVSGGDKASLEAAKGRTLNAVVGIFILFATYVIVKLIEAFFGVGILTLDIDTLIIR